MSSKIHQDFIDSLKLKSIDHAGRHASARTALTAPLTGCTEQLSFLHHRFRLSVRVDSTGSRRMTGAVEQPFAAMNTPCRLSAGIAVYTWKPTPDMPPLSVVRLSDTVGAPHDNV